MLICKYLEHNFELYCVFSSRTRSQLLQKKIKVNREEKEDEDFFILHIKKKGQKVGKKAKMSRKNMKCCEKMSDCPLREMCYAAR